MTLKRHSTRRLHRICDELSLSGDRAVLDKLLPVAVSSKGIGSQSWKIFKEDPFDPRLRAHKIHGLSAHYGRNIFAVVIEGDLRATFCVEADLVVSLTIGTHAIYDE